MEQAGADAAAFAVVYATVMYQQEEVLAGVREVLGPDVPVVGGSTQGISTADGVEEVDRVVGVAIVGADPRIRIHTAAAGGYSEDAADVARRLADQLEQAGARGPLLVWYDPMSGGDLGVLIQQLGARGFPAIIGGGTGQRWATRLGATFQYHGDRALRDTVVCLAIGGDVELHWGVTHGIEPLGVSFEVTRCEGNQILGLDHRPALDVWDEHVGDAHTPDDSAIWALGLPGDPDADHPEARLVARAVYGFLEAERALLMPAGIPPGTRIELCQRTPVSVVDRALRMAEALAARLPTPPLLALSFECAARSVQFLGQPDAEREVMQMQRILGSVPWLGSYCWGEVAPSGNRTEIHNFTFPLVVLCDKAR